MRGESPKSENRDKIVISQKSHDAQQARRVYARAPGGSEDDPREEGCPEMAAIKTKPSPHRGGGIRSRVFGHVTRSRSTNAAFSICPSLYQWSRVTSTRFAG